MNTPNQTLEKIFNTHWLLTIIVGIVLWTLVKFTVWLFLLYISGANRTLWVDQCGDNIQWIYSCPILTTGNISTKIHLSYYIPQISLISDKLDLFQGCTCTCEIAYIYTVHTSIIGPLHQDTIIDCKGHQPFPYIKLRSRSANLLNMFIVENEYYQPWHHPSIRSPCRIVCSISELFSQYCPVGWQYYGGFCYYFSSHAATGFAAAQQWCQDTGAELVSITTREENVRYVFIYIFFVSYNQLP